MRRIKRLGWVPDLPDRRDHIYLVPRALAWPAAADLRDQCPPIYDQDELGSCTANAIAGAVDFERGQQGLPFVNPSRLFIYYNERLIEGTVGTDAGATIRDGFKSINREGVCPEAEWPYDISQFAIAPPAACYVDAMKDRVISYASMAQSLDAMKGRLAEGYPFVFGFTVYSSFDDIGPDGVMTMPQLNESVEGGHAVMAVGYDDARQAILVRNSWGSGWGQGGHFWMPYLYATDPELCDDFWVIKLTSP